LVVSLLAVSSIIAVISVLLRYFILMNNLFPILE
jgi:hypothetical protein